MEENKNNVISEEEYNQAEGITEENTEDTVAINDPDDPLNGKSLKAIDSMMKNMQAMVRAMEEQWNASERELQLTNTHIQQLYKWNEDHKTPMPEGLSKEEEEDWDVLNGIDSITDEEIDRIFGEDHIIKGVDHSQTVDRIKGAMEDFMHWILAMREYKEVHKAYMKLNEMEEEKNIEKLKKILDNAIDENDKKKLQENIDRYYERKTLSYLRNPLDEKSIKRIVDALADENKVQYWINRTRDRLTQYKVPNKFILEIAQFEKRYLEEKYWENSNVLLLYFMQMCIYNKSASVSEDDAKFQILCFVMAMDSLINKTLSEEKSNMILDNIRVLEDQFLGKCPKKVESDVVTPPIESE